MIDQLARTWDAAATLDALPERVNRYRIADLAITYCNASWAAQYGADPEDVVGRFLDEFLSEHEIEGLHSQLALLGPDAPVLVDPIARSTPRNPGQWMQWVDRYLVGPDGPEVLSVGRDVTERHLAERRLAESEARYRDLADKSSDVVWRFVREPAPHFDYISPSIEAVLGYPREMFLDDYRRVTRLVDETSRTMFGDVARQPGSSEQFDVRVRHADGSIVVLETRTTNLHDGIQGVSRDVTELRREHQTLAELAQRDPLTGLANRRQFDQMVGTALTRVARAGGELAIVFIDVDGLKLVNDTHGHESGDEVLRETARRLCSCAGEDAVARIGGDEFVVACELSDHDTDELVDRLDAALSAPITLPGGGAVLCPASIGTSHSRTVGYDADRLLAAADDAMYQVKRVRRSIRIR